MKKLLKILLILIIVIIALVEIASIFLGLKLNKINYENVKVEDIDINNGIEQKLDNYTNIAIFGLDARGDALENTDSRSDCIIIVSINERTKDVRLISVYRDTYVYIEGDGLDKINHAYWYGDAPLAISTLNTNLDLNVTQYLTINFDAVIKAVDAIDGVEIDVTSAEATKISGIYSAGRYNLTGKQALEYGRIRKIDSDYVRTERMRNVLIAAFEKVKKMSYLEINSLTDELLPEVATNISKTEILKYLMNIKEYNVTKSFGWPYEVEPYTGKAWYAVPVTLETNVQKLHEELFENEAYEVSEKVKETSQEIINKTGYGY